MTEYALVGPNSEIKTYSSSVDPTVQTRVGWKWLPVTRTKPSYDPKIQVQEGPTISVVNDTVSVVYSVRDKTAAELDADKDIVLNAFDMLTLKVLFNQENRIRVLEGKSAITVLQYKTALKAQL